MSSFQRALCAASIFGCAAFAATSTSAGIVFADVGKNLEYQQTNATTVVPFNSGTNAFLFARSFYANPTDFNDGTLAVGASSHPYNLEGALDFQGDTGGGYQTGYLTKAEMDAAFRTGATFELSPVNTVTSDTATVNVVFSADTYATVLPKLDDASFNALQNVDPNAGLTVNFNSFTGDPGADVGQGFFTIFDYTSKSVVENYAGFPTGTTSAFLAPGTFTAGDQYVFELIFDNVISRNDDNGILTYARSDVRTLGYFTAPGGAGAVPEPTAWALMLAGFGALGATLRRRRVNLLST
jgi:hypothetical protein